VSRAARGRRAEQQVCAWLEARGARVVGRNVRAGALEIDVVVLWDGVLAFVEVRSRGPASFEGGLESISREKRRRLVAAADKLLRGPFADVAQGLRVRFDVAAVRPGSSEEPEVVYVRGAFTADDA
jgi:putative endonuclease